MERPLSPPPEIFNLESEEDVKEWIKEFYQWSTRLPDLVPKIQVLSVTVDPGPVAAGSTFKQSVAVNGLQKADIVLAVEKTSHTPGMAAVSARVSATNVLDITFMNATSLSIDAGSESYKIVTIRS